MTTHQANGLFAAESTLLNMREILLRMRRIQREPVTFREHRAELRALAKQNLANCAALQRHVRQLRLPLPTTARLSVRAEVYCRRFARWVARLTH